jgi:hypothetical protein
MLAFILFYVADPDSEPEPYVFGLPGSGSISTRHGSGSKIQDPSIIKQK